MEFTNANHKAFVPLPEPPATLNPESLIHALQKELCLLTAKTNIVRPGLFELSRMPALHGTPYGNLTGNELFPRAKCLLTGQDGATSNTRGVQSHQH